MADGGVPDGEAFGWLGLARAGVGSTFLFAFMIFWPISKGVVFENLVVDVVLVVGGMVAVSVLLGIFVVVVDFVGVAEGVVDVELVTTPDVSCDELTVVAVVLVIVGATIESVVRIAFGTSFVLGTVVL